MAAHRKSKLTDDEIRRLYVTERMSSVDIAVLAEVSDGQIRYRLGKMGIAMRSRSEAILGRPRRRYWFGWST